MAATATRRLELNQKAARLRAYAFGVSFAALTLAVSGQPAAAAGPDEARPGLSPAAASARALLNGPRPQAPVTTQAGMGTADPPRRSAPVVGGVDAAGNGEHAGTSSPAPAPAVSAPTVGGIDAAGNGEGPVPAAQVELQVERPAASDSLPRAETAPAAGPAVPARTDVPPAAAQIPASQTPAAQTPAAQVPAAQVPAAQVPAAQVPAAHVPSTEAPAAQATAAEPALPPAPAPVTGVLAPVAEAVAVQIAQPENLGATKKEAEAIAVFYGARQGLPVFVDERGVNARGAAVLDRLAAAGEDGLDPTSYAVTKPPRGAEATALAQAELRLAVAALTYARHAQAGRFDPSRISPNLTPTREIPDPAAVLALLAETADANAALAAFNPPHTGYKALKDKLAAMSRPKTPAQQPFPPGELLKPGDSDPRVPALRARLGLPAVPGGLAYDPALVTAVKAFQEHNRLKPTGVVGATTVAALNRGIAAPPSADMKSDIIANMERWRWLPRDLGAHYVWVNIPEYVARIQQGDGVLHETRIVVGKKETPTPLLSQDMRYAVVNPAWNIPPSIARKEMMPLLRSDPAALARRGIEVVRNGSGGYSFRQSPGERNALGRIKFMFPNDHAVYLHDTPSKALFSRDQRAFSHGCVRVQEPLEFGEVLFNIGMPGQNWTAQRIGKMFGGKERYVMLKQPIPVHLVYFTTFVTGTGRLESRPDLYGINAEVQARLGLDSARRRIAEGAAPARR